MTNQPGDRAYGHGDDVTRLNSTGSQLDAGKWVTPTGDETVDYVDANGAGTKFMGACAYPIADGERGDIRARGVFYARVHSSVVAGEELAAPDSSATSGATEPGVPDGGGSSGCIALTDAKDPDGDGNYYAKVLAR